MKTTQIDEAMALAGARFFGARGGAIGGLSRSRRKLRAVRANLALANAARERRKAATATSVPVSL
jgi:hypothetical protein